MNSIVSNFALPFSPPPRRISPLTAVINFFPGDKVDPSSRSHYADREWRPLFAKEGPRPTVDDNKYKTLIILGITATGIYARAISPFQKWPSLLSDFRRSIFFSLISLVFFFSPFLFFGRLSNEWVVHGEQRSILSLRKMDRYAFLRGCNVLDNVASNLASLSYFVWQRVE